MNSRAITRLPACYRECYCCYSTGSAKLFEDADREERTATTQQTRSSQLLALESQNENWTGEERLQDAVLRMLVDKYKPLRSGTVQSAEQKLKSNPPTIAEPHDQAGSWATQTLLPSKEGHRPWHTEYKAPSHTMSSIKLANIPPPRPAKSNPDHELLPNISDAQKKAILKKTQLAGRLGRARESTLDYRMGIRKGFGSGSPNPASVKGWASLVEDRIERARLNGLFRTVKGHGKPITRTVEESNPFIAREEFLLNRIVQRNGAVPPWVELQGELDSAVSSFREMLRQSWIRRVIRNLTTSHPSELLARFTLADIRCLRDPDWEARERSYHDTAVDELNSLVRKYNGIAPYTVRRPYYMRDVEVQRLYEGCAEEILAQLKEREQALQFNKATDISLDSEISPPARFRDILKQWIAELRYAVSRN